MNAGSLVQVTYVIDDWTVVRERATWRSIVLGNGFSIGVDNSFAYRALLENADLDGRLRAVLDSCGTADFEQGLLSLEHTRRVLDALQTWAVAEKCWTTAQAVDHIAARSLRDALRVALIQAVQGTHPRANVVSHKCKTRITDELAKYRQVFTTTYDLLPYWALLQRDPKPRDFFRKEDGQLRFDLDAAAQFLADEGDDGDDQLSLLYLHGALHLRESADGSVVEKLKRDRSNDAPLLDQITQIWQDEPDLEPLFVSEGESRAKQARIARSPYLTFVHEALATVAGPTVIYGAAMHDQDAHVWRAVRAGADRVAVSVYGTPGDDLEPHEELLGRVYQHLRGREVDLFWSSTHPLGMLHKD